MSDGARGYRGHTWESASCLRRMLLSLGGRPRTRRLVTNFRILEQSSESVTATANFAVWRFQHDATDIYVGRYINILVRGPAGLLFRERRVILDLEPCGRMAS